MLCHFALLLCYFLLVYGLSVLLVCHFSVLICDLHLMLRHPAALHRPCLLLRWRFSALLRRLLALLLFSLFQQILISNFGKKIVTAIHYFFWGG